MAHDWRITVPPELPTDYLFQVMEALRSGEFSIELPPSLKDHPKYAEWTAELNTQTLAAFEKEAARRRS